ncbi:hypothetical protein [Calycomorphotria hydatis]|uniref:Uncharacterized protein n=1 Tax=Calycomorphotria hydatis TaxID=2528027 RepID=A0A517TB72_9PLAN|nr:hypothetical protein [Calycomorphotria hydatis]QDT65623.1 hypothetical protein V22_28810 [Calycomorphotria hydatis]
MKRWKWLLIVLAVPWLYVASEGPVTFLYWQGVFGTFPFHWTLYAPLDWLGNHWLAFNLFRHEYLKWWIMLNWGTN